MAITPLYNTGFEHGRLAQEGGAPFSLVGGDATTRDIVTTPVRNGIYSLKCAPTAALQGRVETPAWAANSKIQTRIAVRINTAPTAVARFLTFIVGAGGDPKIEIDGTNFICSIIDSGRVTGAAFTVGQWHLIEVQINTAATNVTTLDWWVDGVAQTQVTRAQTDTTITKLRFGSASGTGPAYEAYFDDVAVGSWSATSDRFGDGKGTVLKPNADLGAGGGSPANFTVTGAATFWEATDETPLDSTADYVAQTGGTNADWYKIGIADTTETTVNAVQALLQYNSASTPANSAGTYVARSDGTQQTTVYLGDMSESATSLFYKTAQVIAPAAGWTPAAVNDLQWWIGFGSDVNPVPRWHALLLEVDAGAAAPAQVQVSHAELLAPLDVLPPLVQVSWAALLAPIEYLPSAISLVAGGGTPVAVGQKDTAGISGAAIVAGGGGPTAVGQKAATSPPATAGGGTATTVGQKAATATTTIGGGGSPSVAAAKTTSDAGIVAGGGTPSPGTSKTVSGAAVVVGGGTPAPITAKTASGGPQIAGGGDTSPAGAKGATSAALVAGGGTPSPVTAGAVSGVANVAGGGDATAAGLKTSNAAASTAGGGTPSPAASKTGITAVVVVGGGEPVPGGAGQALSGTATVAGGGTPAPNGQKAVYAAIVVAAGGSPSPSAQKVAVAALIIVGGGTPAPQGSRHSLLGAIVGGDGAANPVGSKLALTAAVVVGGGLPAPVGLVTVISALAAIIIDSREPALEIATRQPATVVSGEPAIIVESREPKGNV